MNGKRRVAAGVAAIGLVAAGVAYAAHAMDDGSIPVGHGMRMSSPGMGMAMGSQGMGMGMDMSVESELDFLAGMVPHHEEAIAAAKALARGTERQEMRDFAAAIVATQSAEVRQMERWLADWYPGRDTSVDYEPMMRDLDGLAGDALDRAFLEDMIPHHMMAVMMSQQLLWRGLAEHDAVVPFARSIRDTQHDEIGTMSGWLADWFGGSAMGGMRGPMGGMRDGMGHGGGMGG